MSDSPENKSSLKNTFIIIITIVNLLGLIGGGFFGFGKVFADVGNLQEQMATKENKDVAAERMTSLLREINGLRNDLTRIEVSIREDINRLENKVDAIASKIL